MEPWMPNAIQLAHAALLVVDLNTPGCVENVTAIRETLHSKHVLLVPGWPYDFEAPAASPTMHNYEESDDDDLADPFLVRLPTLLVANKSDINASTEEIEILEELVGVRYPAISVSAETGAGLGDLGGMLFKGLGIVRAYTKIPGHPPDTDRPWTFFHGATVLDVAGGKFDGQQVGRDHVVEDGDILELHG
jgi:ribosome-interacting GTPase 1